jgi:hypothetical protein
MKSCKILRKKFAKTQNEWRIWLIIGPFETLGQRYHVYHFNGYTFDPISGSDLSIPYSLGDSGLTDTLFDPSAVVSTVFWRNTNDLMAFNQNDKTIYKRHIGKHKINPLKASWTSFSIITIN